jgi:hypothetical protein
VHPVAATIEARKLVNGEFFSRSTPNFTNITGTERSSSRLRPWTTNSRKILLHWRGRSATGTLQPKAQAPPRACTDRNGAIVSRSALLWTPAAHANKHAYQGGVGAMPIWVIVAIIPVTLLGGVLLVSGGGARRQTPQNVAGPRAQHPAGRARDEASTTYVKGLPSEQSPREPGAVIIDLGAGAKAWAVRSPSGTDDEQGRPGRDELAL